MNPKKNQGGKPHIEIDAGPYQWHECPFGCGMVSWHHECPNDPDRSQYADLEDDWDPETDIDYFSEEAKRRGWHCNVFGGLRWRS